MQTTNVTTAPPCLGCGHAKRNHIDGEGLCLVKSCHLCLIYWPDVPTKDGQPLIAD
jgi:hypothetical protein